MPSKFFELVGIGINVLFGKTGGRIRSVSGSILEARNNADGAYAIMRGADPAGNNDLVTRQYLNNSGCSLCFGGEVGEGDVGSYFIPHGTASSGVTASLDAEALLACPINGTIDTLAWVAEQGDTITNAVLKILINEIVQATLTISGDSGAYQNINLAVTKGQRIAIEYDAVGDNDAMGHVSIDLFVRGY